MENFAGYKAQIIHRISDVMRRNYMTRAELAGKMGVEYKTVCRLFDLHTYLTVERLVDVAQALNLPVQSLLPGEVHD